MFCLLPVIDQKIVLVFQKEKPIKPFDCLQYEKEKEKELEIKRVKMKFQRYNPKMHDSIVSLFINVMDSFKIKKHQNLLISQVILESRASHYKGNSSQILIGSSGEYGICQILPSATVNLFSMMSKRERKRMRNLGATNFSHINTTSEARIWLSNQKNNIILYGFIMRYYMDLYGNNIKKSIISYNTGAGGMKTFVNSGGILHEHRYYKGVLNINDAI